MAVPFLACMALVAQVYHLPPRVLPAIQAVEGGAVAVVARNTDGSEDLGVMQVNTRWLGRLSQLSRLPVAEVRRRLIDDACFNIAAAGVVMRSFLNETGGDLMQAVGDYHSHTPALNQHYRAQVLGAARRLFEPAQAPVR
jgi:Transglycosylase SLT domain